MKKVCIICNLQGKKLFNVGDKELFHCHNCNFTWTENFIEPNYKNYRLDQTYFNCSSLFKNIFRRIYKISTKNTKKKGRVFEVGASVGNLLEIFQENGWEVSGIEPSDEARKIALEKGIKLLSGKLESTKLSTNYYDLILINHTLEHVADPIAVLAKLHKALKKGGLLVIGVPNFGSLSAQILREKWMHTNPIEHKWHFSPKALRLMSEKLDYKLVSYYTSSGIFEFDNPLAELIESLVTLKKRFFINLLTSPFTYITTKINQGTGILMVVEK